MKKVDSVYLEHIIICISDVERYVKDIEYDVFTKNDMMQHAIFRLFEIIGEASSKISKEIKDNYKEVPWNDMKDMRNRLVHDYFNIRIDVIWNTIKKDLPVLKSQIRKIIEDVDPQFFINFP